MTRPKINVEVCQTPNGMWMVRVQEWRDEELHDSKVWELGFEEATEIGRIALTLFHKRQIEPRTTITQDDQRTVHALCNAIRGKL